ncbi:Gamma-D-glutamyl-L-lysine dipeptidyl-peptidase [Lentibacillus sp. JNUCC-1]|uniref:C40 family peptidase n=1 Tax=Lentibacillus sp. JNUCC-1 TaxID=2654513 RepID=UPI0012E80445|nr:C40 family peptidase [Lentibacillus sp. JNUCC-1]MUV37857.1 Gamma-D-glutamyl-L-lysine dipeptidyl-peptidase [Lentibacillus sp. JNUCC-1]
MKTKTGLLYISLTAVVVIVFILLLTPSMRLGLFSDVPKAVKQHTPATTSINAKAQAPDPDAVNVNQTEAKSDAAFEPNQLAFVNVPVATLWTEPGLDRPVDAVAVGNPADMRKWTEDMSITEKKWLIGNLQTQALYGNAVTIMQVTDGWAEVGVHGQPEPGSDAGYVAWLPLNQLTYETTYENAVETGASAMVTAPTTWLYTDQDMQTPFIEISYNTKLPVLEQEEQTVLVATPGDGQHWIAKDAVGVTKKGEEVPEPTGDALVQSGKQFLGLPYLWAGASGFGFDCSGFTHNVYKAHGMTIPRDASAQALQGKEVAKADLQKGDLLFFADENGEGHVHHVGMYIGNGEMIHAPNTDKTVEIIQVFQSDYWSNEYAGARRFVDEP